MPFSANGRRIDDKLVAHIGRLVLLLALAVAFAFPLGYGILAYRNLVFHVDTLAQVKAGAINALVSGNPNLWAYELQRIEEQLARYPQPIVDEAASVHDVNDSFLVSVGATPAGPLLKRSQALYDSGRVVGRVEVTHSLRGLFSHVALAALLGLMLGGAVYAAVFVFPLRALRRMSVALDAEHAARKAREDRFRALFDRASDGIMILSPSVKLIAVNESFARMHGYSVKEMLNMDLADLDAPATLSLVPSRLQRIRRGETLFFEAEHYHKDGHIFPLEVSLSQIVSGGETLIQAFHRDITVRRQAEEKLKRSEERLQKAQNLAHVGNWDLNVQTGELHWEEENYRIFGLPRETVPSVETFLATIHPDDREFVKQSITDVLEVRKPYDLDMRIRRPDGTERVVHANAELDRNARGEPIRLFGTVQDITERKREEQVHQEREAQLREAQRIAGIGSWEWTPATGIVSWSEGLYLILARNPDLPAPTFETLPQRYTPESWERLRAAVATARASGMPYELELEMVRDDGTLCWTKTRGEAVRGADGAVVRLRGTVEDIDARKRAETERARLEAQLRESQKMEALGTLAGGVAHDFNNIIAAIMGNVELARQDVGPGHPALESLEEIATASSRAKDVVQQILAFSRRQKLVRKVMSLAPVVNESARLLRRMLPAGVRLNVECAVQAPAVLFDATQIEQVLLNLGANAWQAMKGQERPGVIDIRLAAQTVAAAPQPGEQHQCCGEISLLAPGDYACLTVRDNGRGMDQATRSRIFEPFFTTKPVGEGTGLGLAVVQGIVQEHGACVVVHSEPGEGTSVCIYFPAAECPVAAIPEQEPERGPQTRQGPPAAGNGKSETLTLRGEGKRVLYLDDDEAIVFLMSRLLERRGYRVSGYTDARAALAAARAAPGEFDLVVTDYNMPGMSGLEVARALRAIRPDLPVALASGYISEELREQAPAAGVRELLYKPNTVDDLCEVVARLANTLPA